MDIPLAYIIFDIMISLKKNNRDTMIYRDILIIYLKRFINSFDLDKDVLEDHIFEFNLANELSYFLDHYEDYYQVSESSEQASGDPYHEQNGWTACRLIKRHDYSLDSLYYYYYIKRYGTGRLFVCTD